MKTFKNTFPKVINGDMLYYLDGKARGLIIQYTRDIFPVLRKYAIFNDQAIRNIMLSETMQSIYEEAVRCNERLLNLLEEIAISNEEDFWRSLRAPECEAKSPREDWFEFREMPLGKEPAWIKNAVGKSISVNGCKISYSYEILKEEAIYNPSDKQRELYDMLVEFCQRLKTMGIKCDENDILFSRYGGYIEPNVHRFLYRGIGK